MKKFNRNMLAHLNAANKKSTQTEEKKSFNTNKKGIKDLEIKLYEGKRHEILNEDNKQEVYDDVYNWLIKHLN